MKCTHGSQLLLVVASVTLLTRASRQILVSLVTGFLPHAVLFVLVSSETSCTHHVRYVIPAWVSACIIGGGSVLILKQVKSLWFRLFVVAVCAGAPLHAAWSVWGSTTDPVAYYNEAAGGSHNGFHHLLFSNTDWGQSDPSHAGSSHSLLRRLYVSPDYSESSASTPIGSAEPCFVSVQFMKGGPKVNLRLAGGRTVVFDPERFARLLSDESEAARAWQVSPTHFQVDQRLVDASIAGN